MEALDDALEDGKRTKMLTSHCTACGEVTQPYMSGSNSGHWLSGISIDAMAEMTRAAAWRTILLREIGGVGVEEEKGREREEK